MEQPVIRLLVTLLFFLWGIGKEYAIGQTPGPMFYKEIQMEHKNYTLDELSREIQQQSGITFSYNAHKINARTSIRIRNKRQTVLQLLDHIQSSAGISNKIINGRHIIYTGQVQKKATKRKQKAGKKKATATDVKREEKQESPVAPPQSTPVLSDVQEIAVIGDTAVASAYYLSGGGGSYGGAYQMVPKFSQDKKDQWYDPNAALYRGKENVPLPAPGGNDLIGAFLKENVLLNVGFLADEIYYFNPTIAVGFSFINFVVSYNTGSYAHWRYGLGSNAPINDRWDLQLSFNTGKSFSSQYGFTTFDTIPVPSPDSFPQPPIIVPRDIPVQVQSRLTRYTIGAAYNLDKSFSLSAGITLNYLSTTYSSLGAPLSFNSLMPGITDADRQYRTISPPYLLKNTYSDNLPSNVKLWLGIQIGFSYRFLSRR